MNKSACNKGNGDSSTLDFDITRASLEERLSDPTETDNLKALASLKSVLSGYVANPKLREGIKQILIKSLFTAERPAETVSMKYDKNFILFDDEDDRAVVSELLRIRKYDLVEVRRSDSGSWVQGIVAGAGELGEVLVQVPGSSLGAFALQVRPPVRELLKRVELKTCAVRALASMLVALRAQVHALMTLA